MKTTKKARQRSKESGTDNTGVRVELPTQFVQDLVTHVQEGKSVIPFVGAGMSFDAGIPTNSELTDYLWDCLDNVIYGNPQINLMEVGWPSIDEWRRRSAAQNNRLGIPADIKGKLPYHADWKGLLTTITALKKLDRTTLGKPDQVLIDLYNRTFTAGRHPSLGHILLAQLARPMRIRCVLTTNFDNLLERAFADARHPLTVFDVHMNDPLPSFRLVRAQESLIKMHGDRFSMRSDFSLDQFPSQEDKFEFCSYAFGLPLTKEIIDSIDDAESGTVSMPRAQSLILVAGNSGEDLRIREMMLYAQHVGIPVYWICHTVGTLNTLKKLMEKDLIKLCKKGLPPLTCTVARADELFYTLHQHLTSFIPPSGTFRYKPFAFARVEPNDSRQSDNTTFDTIIDSFQTVTEGSHSWLCKRSSFSSNGTLLEVTESESDNDSAGRSSWVAHQYEKFCRKGNSERSLIKIWIELDECVSPEHAVRRFIRAIAEMRGLKADSTLMPQMNLVGLKFTEQFERLGVLGSDVLVVFYGHSGPGASRHWTTQEADTAWDISAGLEKHENGPLDAFLSDIAEAGAYVVYLPFPSARYECIYRRKPGNSELPDETFQQFVSHCVQVIQKELTNKVPSCCTLDNSVIERIVIRYLRACALMRRLRIPAALQGQGAQTCISKFFVGDGVNDNETVRVCVAMQMSELLKSFKNHVRTRSGGGLWFRRVWRNELAERIRNYTFSDASRTCSSTPSTEDAEVHRLLGEWFEMSFRATHDVDHILEALYHTLESARLYQTLKDDFYLNSCLLRIGRLLSDGAEVLALELDYEEIQLIENFSKHLQGFAGRTDRSSGSVTGDADSKYLITIASMQGTLRYVAGQIAERVGFEIKQDSWGSTLESPNPSHSTHLSNYTSALWAMYRNAKELFEKRELDEAIRLFHILLSELCTTVTPSRVTVPRLWLTPEPGENGFDPNSLEELREEARSWYRSVSRDPADTNGLFVHVELGLNSLRRLAHCYFALGKTTATQTAFDGLRPVMYCDIRELKPGNKPASAFWYWQYASCLLNHALRLASHLPPYMGRYYNDIHYKLLSMYGLTLASLQRFVEARRRFDECATYLHHITEGAPAYEWGYICCRRAEMYCMELENLMYRENSSYEKVLTVASEAYVAATRAEWYFEGRTRSLRLWARVLVTQCRILAAIAFASRQKDVFKHLPDLICSRLGLADSLVYTKLGLPSQSKLRKNAEFVCEQLGGGSLKLELDLHKRLLYDRSAVE